MVPWCWLNFYTALINFVVYVGCLGSFVVFVGCLGLAWHLFCWVCWLPSLKFGFELKRLSILYER